METPLKLVSGRFLNHSCLWDSVFGTETTDLPLFSVAFPLSTYPVFMSVFPGVRMGLEGSLDILQDVLVLFEVVREGDL